MRISPNKSAKKFLGFTLLELLVVMAIVGILAAIGLSSYGTVQSKARDARRKSDLENVARALEMYYNDNKAYPSGNSDGQIIKGATVFAWGTQWLDTVVYMEKLPSDSRGKYFYESQSVAPGTNNGYRLYARLENAEDQKAARVPITLVAGKYLPATILCGTGKGCNYVIMSTNVSAPPIDADSP